MVNLKKHKNLFQIKTKIKIVESWTLLSRYFCWNSSKTKNWEIRIKMLVSTINKSIVTNISNKYREKMSNFLDSWTTGLPKRQGSRPKSAENYNPWKFSIRHQILCKWKPRESMKVSIKQRSMKPSEMEKIT